MNSRTNKLTNFSPTIVSQFIINSLQWRPLLNIFNGLRKRRVILATQSTSPNTMFDLLSRDFLSHRMLMTTEVKCAPSIDLIGGLFFTSLLSLMSDEGHADYPLNKTYKIRVFICRIMLVPISTMRRECLYHCLVLFYL